MCALINGCKDIGNGGRGGKEEQYIASRLASHLTIVIVKTSCNGELSCVHVK